MDDSLTAVASTTGQNANVHGAAACSSSHSVHDGDGAALLQERRRHYGPNTSLHYTQPLTVVRGAGTYLYDDNGLEYLDCVNNVAQVGHGNAEVAEAISKQLLVLNTNTRYLNPHLASYTRQLLSTLPNELQVLYMVNSGSEANDLALRIAMTARPGATHVAVMATAYHGHTASLIPLSPYKFWGNGGQGKEPYVHIVPLPDPYRGENLDGRAAARAVIAEARRAGGHICAFFCESILGCGGQVLLPPGYLKAVYEEMREEGAVCLADEVQCGFGRVGEAFWGFQTQDVVPDIVTMGKPTGNGYPVAGLVCTRRLADAFANGMEYFNTFGGSNAAVAAAQATLDIVMRDGLQAHAKQVGDHFMAGLQAVQASFPCLGDVRGLGLFIGVEVVAVPPPGPDYTPAYTLSQHQPPAAAAAAAGEAAAVWPSCRPLPAPRLAKWIKERLKASHRVLISTDGPYDHVLKIKPPLVFGVQEADMVTAALRRVLSEELTPPVWAALQQDEAAHAAAVTLPLRHRYVRDARQVMALVSQEAAAASAATIPAARL